jgi:hypothetical protein
MRGSLSVNWLKGVVGRSGIERQVEQQRGEDERNETNHELLRAPNSLGTRLSAAMVFSMRRRCRST